MGMEQFRKWTCDSCLYELQTKTTELAVGWTQVRWNTDSPLGSMDADGWGHMVICPECTSIFLSSINL